LDQPRYEEAYWPIVLVTMPPQELGEVDMMRHLDRISSYRKRGLPFVLIVDVRDAAPLGARSRRMVAERMDQDQVAYPGAMLGVAVVLVNSFQRGIMKAISWLSTRPRPYEPFSTLEDAMRWANRLLATAPAQSATSPVATNASKRVS
jgi:hypothetical protein